MKKLIIIFVIIFSSRVYAQTALSMGHLDCGRFLSSCDRSLLHIDCQAQKFWAQGVITGLNSAELGGKTEVGKGVSADTIKHVMIKYCRDNPLKNTYHATHYIYMQLLPKAPR